MCIRISLHGSKKEIKQKRSRKDIRRNYRSSGPPEVIFWRPLLYEGGAIVVIQLSESIIIKKCEKSMFIL